METTDLLSLNLKDRILSNNLGEPAVFNNHTYDFELYITNSTKKYIKIPPTAIKNFTVKETLANWVIDGSLTVGFDNEIIELYNQFAFRNDGEDFLRFRIVPFDASSSYDPSLNITKKVWEINSIFCIYDIQDVTSQTRGNTDASGVTKLKKFFFHDVRYQVMLARNIEYSTALSSKAKISSTDTNSTTTDQYLDSNRSIRTDYAIDEIIKKAFDNDTLLAKTGLDVEKDEWDTGKTDIFYTSGASENSYSDLMYVFSRHVSSSQSDGIDDCCILDIEREEGGLGYFSLKPLTHYFANAGKTEPGPYQIEHFFFKNDVVAYKSTRAANTYRAPILTDATGQPTNKTSTSRDFKINDYNVIDKYEFVDISPAINSLGFITRPVHSFNFSDRKINIEFNKNSVKNIEEIFNKKYINNLYKSKTNTGTGNFLAPVITPSKINNSSVAPIFSVYGNDTNQPEIRSPDAHHRLLRFGLFQNTCISFIVPGLTFRKPGTFIGIDRFGGSQDNTLDDKLCGQWFVINIEHIFAAGMYYNEVTAVKIHRFNPIDFLGDVNVDDKITRIA